MSSTLGKLFRVTTYGESHGRGVGAVVDGCPPLLALREEEIQIQLDRRKPGQSPMTTDRQESDRVTILSGVENGVTQGTPIALFVPNRDQRPGDYTAMNAIPRPSHADYTYQIKYGVRAASGGGRASARETIGRVAAGAIAEKLLHQAYGTQIVAWVSSVGAIDAAPVDMAAIMRDQVDGNAIRCPDPSAARQMMSAVEKARNTKDSLGGVITCVCRNVPSGLGEPVFDKLEALLAGAMLSIPATKGFDVGSGFDGSRMSGSAHNDPFVKKNNGLGTVTNFSGGIQGGISNGEPIYFRVAFKPPATIGFEQTTCDFGGQPVLLSAAGRHDPCVVARAVPIVETMAALVLADCALRQAARSNRNLTPCRP